MHRSCFHGTALGFAQLEEAVARLFRAFFQIGDDLPWKIRQQKRGTQGGYDLSIEWSGTFEVAGNASVVSHRVQKLQRTNHSS